MNIFKSIGDLFRPASIDAFAHGTSYATHNTIEAHRVDDERISKTQISATVYTCCDLICKAIANVEFVAKEKYWNDAFNDPNIMQSRYDFWYSVAWDALIYGNVYILKHQEKGASKGILAPLHPPNIEPLGSMVSPKYRARDTGEEYDGSRIIHIRHGGGSELRAIGRVAAGYRRIMALESCDIEIESVFSNGVSMSHVLHGGHADKDAVLNMLKSIKKAFGIGGKHRAGVVGITGGFKLDTIKGATPADSDMRNLRVDLIREIAALFGIPPFAAGGSSDTKFSNVVARHAQLAKDALLPLSTNIAQKLEHNLETPVTFSDEDLLKGDFGTALELAIKASGGPVRTPNEARDVYLGLTEVEGGDELRDKPAAKDELDPDRRGEKPPDGSESDR